jgi:agmatinase
MTPITGLPAEKNFLGLPPEHSDPTTAGVIILPVPFERTSTYGQGSCHGAAAILAASHEIELFDCELAYEPYLAAGGIATLPELSVAGSHGKEVASRLRDIAGEFLTQGKFLITLGGEHTSVVGAIQAHCDLHAGLTVLQLDAHSDLRQAYRGSSWNHACAMARVLDFHGKLVQVGIRSQDRHDCNLARERKIPVFMAHRIVKDHDQGKDWYADVIAAIGPRVYITLDCDVMDPGIIPATGTPEPGGLTWSQVDALLARVCSEREVVGLDVSELAPLPDLVHPQFSIAKLIHRFIGRRFGQNHHGA